MLSDIQAIRKRLEEMSSEELSRVYMNLFNTDEGQLVLEDLRNRAFVKVSTLPEHGPMCAMTAARNEGRRSMILHIETQLLPNPEPQTQKEEE